MESQRFDAFARTVADGFPRRGVLRLLAGGALGGLLTRLGLEEAAAACANVGQRCQFNDGSRRNCCDGAYCHQNRCRCRRRQDRCGSGNNRRCCGADERCVQGICTKETGTCGAGYVCGGQTRDCGQPTCGGLGPCQCTEGVDGTVHCADDICLTLSCTSNADCESEFGAGFFCQKAGTGCCGQVCIPPCGSNFCTCGRPTNTGGTVSC